MVSLIRRTIGSPIEFERTRDFMLGEILSSGSFTSVNPSSGGLVGTPSAVLGLAAGYGAYLPTTIGSLSSVLNTHAATRNDPYMQYLNERTGYNPTAYISSINSGGSFSSGLSILGSNVSGTGTPGNPRGINSPLVRSIGSSYSFDNISYTGNDGATYIGAGHSFSTNTSSTVQRVGSVASGGSLLSSVSSSNVNAMRNQAKPSYFGPEPVIRGGVTATGQTYGLSTTSVSAPTRAPFGMYSGSPYLQSAVNVANSIKSGVSVYNPGYGQPAGWADSRVNQINSTNRLFNSGSAYSNIRADMGGNLTQISRSDPRHTASATATRFPDLYDAFTSGRISANEHFGMVLGQMALNDRDQLNRNVTGLSAPPRVSVRLSGGNYSLSFRGGSTSFRY